MEKKFNLPFNFTYCIFVLCLHSQHKNKNMIEPGPYETQTSPPTQSKQNKTPLDFLLRKKIK